jgi:hypothetical protein
MNPAVKAVLAAPGLSELQRHRMLRELSPSDAAVYATVNAWALRVQQQREDEQADVVKQQATEAEAKRLPPSPQRDRLAAARQLYGAMGSAIFYRANKIDIAREDRERERAMSELDPPPPEAA